MAHFGDCCDPFMRLRMASNGYEAILSVMASQCPSFPASCFSAFRWSRPVPACVSCPCYSRYLVCSCDCDFYFCCSLRFVCFALLCFALLVLFARLSAHVTWQFVWSSHIWGKCRRLSVHISVCVCVCDIRASFCIFCLLLILETWQRM